MILTATDQSSAPALAALRWNNRFASLGPVFATAQDLHPLKEPYWISRNEALARELGLDQSWLASVQALQALTGNQLLAGAQPIASVYSGHQFGQWAG